MRTMPIILRAVSFFGLPSAAIVALYMAGRALHAERFVEELHDERDVRVCRKHLQVCTSVQGRAARPAGCCATSETDARSHKRKIRMNKSSGP